MQLQLKDWEDLADTYEDFAEACPWRRVRHKGNRMNMDLHPSLAAEIRFLALVHGCGQGFIVRKMMEAIKKKKVKVDFGKR